MKERICARCGRKAPDDGSGEKKFICVLCGAQVLKATDLREQERKIERYRAALWRKKVGA